MYINSLCRGRTEAVQKTKPSLPHDPVFVAYGPCHIAPTEWCTKQPERLLLFTEPSVDNGSLGIGQGDITVRAVDEYVNTEGFFRCLGGIDGRNEDSWS